MEFPKPQEQQSIDEIDYNVVVCVAGTRHFNDRHLFHEKILEFLELQEEPVLFLSGAAPSGADDLIIRWCKRFIYPCKKMPADWDNERNRPNFNRRAAGFVRNEEMSQICTHLIAFYDGQSHGTQDMIERCESKKRHLQIINITIPPDSARKNYGHNQPSENLHRS